MEKASKIIINLAKVIRENLRFWYWLLLTGAITLVTLKIWSAVYDKVNLVILFYVSATVTLILLFLPLYHEIRISTPFGEFHGIQSRRDAARKNELKSTQNILKRADAALHTMLLNSPESVTDDILKLINILKGNR